MSTTHDPAPLPPDDRRPDDPRKPPTEPPTELWDELKPAPEPRKPTDPPPPPPSGLFDPFDDVPLADAGSSFARDIPMAEAASAFGMTVPMAGGGSSFDLHVPTAEPGSSFDLTVPMAEPASLSPDAPAGSDTIDLGEPPVARAESGILGTSDPTVGDSVRLGAAPPADPAQPASGVVDYDGPAGGPAAGGDSVRLGDPPLASPVAGSGVIDPADLATGSPAGDSVRLGAVPPIDPAPPTSGPIAPVAPASGWGAAGPSGEGPRMAFAGQQWGNWDPTSDAHDAPPPPPPAEVTELSDRDLFGDNPPGSDRTRKPLSDKARTTSPESDVLWATAYHPSGAGSDRDRRPTEPSSSELFSCQSPAGGGTQQDSGANDLPLAEELPESSRIRLDSPGGGIIDSADLAGTPDFPLPPEAAGGRRPPSAAGPDPSSILGAFELPPPADGGDGSAVRLDAPGVDPTVFDDPLPEFRADRPRGKSSAPDSGQVNPWGEPSDAGATVDWQSQPGSGLFGEKGDQPSGVFDLADPGGPPSSIFSGGPVPPGDGSDWAAQYFEEAERVAGEPSPMDRTAPMAALPSEPRAGGSSAAPPAGPPAGKPRDDEDAIDWNLDASEESPSLSGVNMGQPPPSGRISRIHKPPTPEEKTQYMRGADVDEARDAPLAGAGGPAREAHPDYRGGAESAFEVAVDPGDATGTAASVFALRQPKPGTESMPGGTPAGAKPGTESMPGGPASRRPGTDSAAGLAPGQPGESVFKIKPGGPARADAPEFEIVEEVDPPSKPPSGSAFGFSAAPGSGTGSGEDPALVARPPSGSAFALEGEPAVPAVPHAPAPSRPGSSRHANESAFGFQSGDPAEAGTGLWTPNYSGPVRGPAGDDVMDALRAKPPADQPSSFVMDVVHDVDGLREGPVDPSDPIATVPQPALGGAAARRDSGEKPRKKGRKKAKSGSGGWVGGTLVGLVAGVGTCAAAYFGGFLPSAGPPKSTAVAVAPPPSTDPVLVVSPKDTTKTAADAKTALKQGDPAGAMAIFQTAPADTPEAKADRGQARLLAHVHAMAKTGAADAGELGKATADLRDAVAKAPATPDGRQTAARAALALGLTEEVRGDLAAARRTYLDARAKFPGLEPLFDAAVDRLDATQPAAPKGEGRLAPADAADLLRAATLLLVFQAEAPDAPAADPGALFWKAVNAAKAGRFADATAAITKAREAHEKRRLAVAGRGLNPLSDPLEQIFTRSCDDLKDYWELRAALYNHPGVGALVKKDGVAKALDEFAAARKLAADAAANAAVIQAAVEKLKPVKLDDKPLPEAIDALAKAAAKAEADKKAAAELAVKFEKDYKAAAGDLAKSKKELDAAKADAASAAATVTAVSKELQSAKLLGDKADAPALVAAVRDAAERATGPNLGSLLPNPSAAVGGSGMAAGLLMDVVGRLAKAETGVKAAAAKLAAETKRLTDEKAAAVAKANEDRAAEVAKVTEKAAADAKSLREAAAAEAKKSRDALAAQKAAQEAELAAREKSFREQLKGAKPTADSLDLWLPLLAEVRRPADADPALRDADAVLAAASPGSDDRGKALVVKGYALLAKGDPAGAARAAADAKAAPAYDAAKPWAKAADDVLALVRDPLARKRVPATGGGAALTAARALDEGVVAYRAGRFRDAERAFNRAAEADAGNPVAWYYLGASRWALGRVTEAKADFAQGGEREKTRGVPLRQIQLAIAPIQGGARAAIDSARP